MTSPSSLAAPHASHRQNHLQYHQFFEEKILLQNGKMEFARNKKLEFTRLKPSFLKRRALKGFRKIIIRIILDTLRNSKQLC